MSYNEAKQRAADLGREGERRVEQYLKQKGYIIVKRNYRERFGEIDIIAENDTYLVFVEVKTRSDDALVSGMEAVDRKKQMRIYNTGNHFLKKLHIDLIPRFDVAQVTVSYENDCPKWSLEYIKNAF
ncbi:MAG: YraN family protein [Ruminococcaceae bacterium]|nr:YraN family protein [Oscillospiraceae bacterium]